MAGSLNRVTLIGNLGKDPEIRTTKDGREIANFNIATSETWKDKGSGEKKEKTEWHNIVVFNEGLVRVIKNHIKKGSKIYIEGQLHTRKWTDKDNNERYTTEIVLQNYNSSLLLLDFKSDESSNYNNDKQQNTSKFDNSELDDEIPF